MKPFAFHAKLFDCRNEVLELLADHGFAWLSDFGAIDLQHDVYGLEVTGIRDEGDARAIENLLRKLFSDWQYQRLYYEDHNVGELGWKVTIARDPDNYNDDWQQR